MFDRYSMASLQMIAISRVEAGLTSSAVIRTEHLLLAVLRIDPSLVQRIGCTLSVDQVRVHNFPTKVTESKLAISSDLPISQDVKEVFEYAAAAVKAHNSNLVRTEHLLLGLMMVKSSAAATLLKNSGASLAELERVVSRLEPDQDQKGNDQWMEDYANIFK